MGESFQLSPKDARVTLNALALYELWLIEKGTTPESLRDIPEDQRWVIERLRELKLSPKHTLEELKANALSQTRIVTRRLAQHVNEWSEEEEISSWLV
jgi:hypothetical protein